MSIENIYNSFCVDNLICPITHLYFLNPTVADDGFIYEYSAIKKWLSFNSISPLNRQSISKHLILCLPLKNFIKLFLNINPHLQHLQFKKIKSYNFIDNIDKINKIITNKKLYVAGTV